MGKRAKVRCDLKRPSSRLLLVWSVTLAGIPRIVRWGVEPSAPGLPAIYLLSIALLVVSLTKLVLPLLGGKTQRLFRDKVGEAATRAGLLATVALLATEICVSRIGYDSAAYRRLEDSLVLAEFIFGLIAQVGWLVAPSEGSESAGQGLASTIALCSGAAIPLAAIWLAGTPFFAFAKSPLLVCAASAVSMGLLLAILFWANALSSSFAMFYTAGQLLLWLLWWGQGAASPFGNELVLCVLALCVLVALVSAAAGILIGKIGAEEPVTPRPLVAGASAILDELDGADRLSPREREVASLTIAGMADSQIAIELQISKSSVGTLRRRVYQKLSVADKGELLQRVRWDVQEASDAAQGSSNSRPVFLCGAYVLVALALNLVVPLVLRSAFPQLAGWETYLTRGAGAVTLVMGCAFIAASDAVQGTCRRSSRSLRLAGIVCSVLQAYGVHSAIQPVSSIAPCAYAAICLSLLLIAQSAEAADGELSFAALRQGISGFAGLSVWHVAACVASLNLFDYLAYRNDPPGVISGIPLLAEFLAASVVILCLRAIRNARVTSVGRASLDSTTRATLYLRGRGLSEAQAEAIALLALGASPNEVCGRCHVSPGSLGTFRSRAYKKLGVNTMDDLRVVLRREANLLEDDKVSPRK